MLPPAKKNFPPSRPASARGAKRHPWRRSRSGRTQDTIDAPRQARASGGLGESVKERRRRLETSANASGGQRLRSTLSSQPPPPPKKKRKKTQTGRRQVLPGAPLRPRLLRPGLQGHRRRCLPGTPRHSGGRAAVQARGLGHGGPGERGPWSARPSLFSPSPLSCHRSGVRALECVLLRSLLPLYLSLSFSPCVFFLLTQERYSSLAPLYYRGAAAAAVVFDVGDRESFAKARHWVGELQRNAGPGIGERERGGGRFRPRASSFLVPRAEQSEA